MQLPRRWRWLNAEAEFLLRNATFGLLSRGHPKITLDFEATRTTLVDASCVTVEIFISSAGPGPIETVHSCNHEALQLCNELRQVRNVPVQKRGTRAVNNIDAVDLLTFTSSKEDAIAMIECAKRNKCKDHEIKITRTLHDSTAMKRTRKELKREAYEMCIEMARSQGRVVKRAEVGVFDYVRVIDSDSLDNNKHKVSVTVVMRCVIELPGRYPVKWH